MSPIDLAVGCNSRARVVMGGLYRTTECCEQVEMLFNDLTVNVFLFAEEEE